jgi:hypothetical protein
MLAGPWKYVLFIVAILVLLSVCYFSAMKSSPSPMKKDKKTAEKEGLENENENQITLVVSRYNENLEWLKERPFNKYPVICYNKGPNDNFYKPPNMTIVRLPNVGRCDHTYLYHIVTNYNKLTNHTMFLPGSCDLDFKNEKAKIWLKETEKRIRKSGNDDQGGRAVFYGSATAAGIKEEFGDFQLDDWQATYGNNRELNPESKLKKRELRPFRVWYEHHFGDLKVHYYTMVGIFGIHKMNILQHPKSYYENFLKELDDHSNPEVGHYFERGWAAVFHPLNHTDFI